MSRISYINGSYIRKNKASVLLEDRALQFSDGVYEVMAISKSSILEWERHMHRLYRSLSSLEIKLPMKFSPLKLIVEEVIRLNKVNEGFAYIQINRGTDERNHIWKQNISPTLIVTTKPGNLLNFLQTNGVEVITLPDKRWKRCDIKSVSLLPNVLLKQKAHYMHAFECWMFDTLENITEGTSSNTFIIINEKIITRPLSSEILGGINREIIIDIAISYGFSMETRNFSISEAECADEAFQTNTTSLIVPVVKINDTKIGNGRPGNITKKLQNIFFSRIFRKNQY
tara:strand:+ start:654 stop:1508 length:855 start_codon:yes stop_codon:yes gene_type:complete